MYNIHFKTIYLFFKQSYILVNLFESCLCWYLIILVTMFWSDGQYWELVRISNNQRSKLAFQSIWISEKWYEPFGHVFKTDYKINYKEKCVGMQNVYYFPLFNLHFIRFKVLNYLLERRIVLACHKCKFHATLSLGRQQGEFIGSSMTS